MKGGWLHPFAREEGALEGLELSDIVGEEFEGVPLEFEGLEGV